MSSIESVAAGAFYLGLVLFCVGAIAFARSAVERKPARFAPLLAIAGIAFIGAALAAYARGPHHVLPF